MNRSNRGRQSAPSSYARYVDEHVDDYEPDHRAGRTRPRRDRRRDQRQRFNNTPARREARHRDDGRESFKCGHCKTFIGPTISGGRHRNHCPLCLHSRHVDGDRPGDRLSECRSLMAPVGTFFRPKGEQVILHRCLGCGLERHNRVAADDHPITLMRLPLVPPRLGGKRAERVEREAIG